MKEDKSQKPKIKYADETTCIPSTLEKTIKIDDITFMAPRGSKQTDLVFVSACPLEEETEEGFSPAFLLKGPVGTLIQRSLLKCGIDIEKCWYTTLIKHCIPRRQKLKPTATQIEANKHLIDAELKEIKPKLIVCFGKSAFDYFCNYRLKMNEAIGGIFHSKEYNCMIYCMDDAVKLLFKPELLERFYVDLKEIKKTIDSLNGIEINKVPLNYRTINTKADLIAWVEEVKNERIFSVDCEWGGKNFVDGQLRYTQFAWKPGHAVCLQFYDCEKNYKFDIPFAEIGAILSPVMNHPETRFVGHNICADAVWLDKWLNINIYQRVMFDTMFAMHSVDESADLKLERLAVKWTDLGRYDIELIIWKKENGVSVDEGYERVPDEILIPYSCKDVDATLRCVPILIKLLIDDGIYEYYMSIKLPFVTDGFFEIVKTGLPVDLTDIDSQRNAFIFVKDTMSEIFLDKLEEEAKVLLFTKLATILDFMVAAEVYNEVIEALPTDRVSIIDIVKKAVKRDYPKIIHTVEHLVNCRNFKHTSADDLKQYLYVVKGYIPVKTTKTDGMPSVNWEKILALTPEQQKEYKPSTDGDTLQVFADKGDELLQFLLTAKAVATITRSFLRPQDEEGNEEGLIGHVCSDGRIHSTLYLTDTNRPRLTFLFLKMICISKIKVDMKEYLTNILALRQRTINYSLKSVSAVIKNLKHLTLINIALNVPLLKMMV